MINKSKIEEEQAGLYIMWFIIGLLAGLVWVMWSMVNDGFWYQVFSSKGFSWFIRIVIGAAVIFVLLFAIYKTIKYIAMKQIYIHVPQQIQQVVPVAEPVEETEDTEEDEDEEKIIVPVNQVELVYVNKEKDSALNIEDMVEFENRLNFTITNLMKKHYDKNIQIGTIHTDRYQDGLVGVISYKINIDINS